MTNDEGYLKGKVLINNTIRDVYYKTMDDTLIHCIADNGMTYSFYTSIDALYIEPKLNF